MTRCYLESHNYDEFVDDLEKTIAGPHKCAVLGILDDPPFSYSVGLTDQGWPELIIVGVKALSACSIINNMVKCFAADGVPKLHTDIDHIVEGYPVRLEPISEDQLDEYMLQAVRRQKRVGGPSPRALQIVYPDEAGRWPDDPECDAVTVHAQMLSVKEEVQ